MEWMENLPDELKDNKALQQYKSLDAALQGFINTKKDVGNSIRVNGPDASAEERTETYQKIMRHYPNLTMKPDMDNAEQSRDYYAMNGVPESPQDYPTEGIELPENVMQELQTLAHNTHMSKTQWKEYAGRMSEMNTVTHQNREDARITAGAELKDKWGLAFEDRYAVVERYLDENPGFGTIDTMTPDIIEAHYNSSRSLNGVKQMHNQPAPRSKNTPDEARARIKEIDDNPIRFSSDPADRHEQQRMNNQRIEYMREAYPEKYA
jgi:hypothetical protein